jgi:hypothetical protein
MIAAVAIRPQSIQIFENYAERIRIVAPKSGG